MPGRDATTAVASSARWEIPPQSWAHLAISRRLPDHEQRHISVPPCGSYKISEEQDNRHQLPDLPLTATQTEANTTCSATTQLSLLPATEHPQKKHTHHSRIAQAPLTTPTASADACTHGIPQSERTANATGHARSAALRTPHLCQSGISKHILRELPQLPPQALLDPPRSGQGQQRSARSLGLAAVHQHGPHQSGAMAGLRQGLEVTHREASASCGSGVYYRRR
mmetsp:Transcript_48740/g.128899  ORF Transcript_48740/g.128899 Transcript_48740/m.128899 type:complete len:225 (-) Transcript_48740:460-1134(-)